MEPDQVMKEEKSDEVEIEMESVKTFVDKHDGGGGGGRDIEERNLVRLMRKQSEEMVEELKVDEEEKYEQKVSEDVVGNGYDKMDWGSI